MAVDIGTWRARIGLFNSVSFKSAFGGPWPFLGRCLNFNLHYFLVLSALLIIGNIELNPGPFPCTNCSEQFSTMGESALHQKSHIHEKNFMFSCHFSSCQLKFYTFKALDVHLSRIHKHNRNKVLSLGSPIVFQCPKEDCLKTFDSMRSVCHHIKSAHQDKGEMITCPLSQKCGSLTSFSKSSFSTHLSHYHSGWTKINYGYGPESSNFDASTSQTMNVSQESCNNVDVEADENVEIGAYEDPGEPKNDSFVIDEDSFDGCELLKEKDDYYAKVAKFYLMLETEKMLPVSAVQAISVGLSFLTESNMSIMKKYASKVLTNMGLEAEKVEHAVTNIFAEDCLFATHHKECSGPSFNTNALRKAFYRQTFYYVEPIEINLSKDFTDPRYIYYVPIRETLELILSCPVAQKQIDKSFTRKNVPGLFEDYQDGSLYQSKRNGKGKSIDLLIFQDCFNPTKDLSSTALVHQTLGMYLSVGNLQPNVRSKLASMKLLLLIPKFKVLFQELKQKCFQPVIDELKQLEVDGILYKGETIAVRLQFLLGDNLGQHEIGGFVTGFNGNFFCRFCPIDKESFRSETWKVEPLRTPDDYDKAVKTVDEQELDSFTGIRGSDYESAFNKLCEFHVSDPGLSPCLAHDAFEGVVNYDLALLLTELVKENWFTFEILNRLISKFKYIGHDSNNKPAPIKYDKKTKISTHLGGHAVQNWTLLRLLPFILSPSFIKDKKNEFWTLYLQMKKILEYLCAPKIRTEQLALLKILIEDYMYTRQIILQKNAKPKHHYLCHYADLTEIMGPLIHLFTLRFENFHQFFKRAVRSANNFINIGKTMTMKYCLYLAYLATGPLYCLGVSVSDYGRLIDLNSLKEKVASIISSAGFTSSALFVKSAIVDEVCFKQGDWLLLGNYNDSDDLVVGKIENIIMDRGSISLIVEEYFAKFLNAYGVHVINADSILKVSCLLPEDLHYPSSHSVYEFGEKQLCFSLKHTMVNSFPL